MKKIFCRKIAVTPRAEYPRKIIAVLPFKWVFLLLAAFCTAAVVASFPAVGATAHPTETGKIRLAVLYFDNECITDRERLDAFQKGIADTLITDLGRLDRLQVVERERLDALLSELKLQQSGLVDRASATKIGRLLGVQALLMGSYTAIGEMIRIDARIVEVETGLVLKAEEVTGRTDDFFKLEEALVAKIAAGMNVPLTTDERTLLARAGERSFAAFLEYSRGLDEMDRGRYPEAEKAFQEALRIDPGFEKAALKRKELQQKRGNK
jgi:TolB-like protein